MKIYKKRLITVLGLSLSLLVSAKTLSVDKHYPEVAYTGTIGQSPVYLVFSGKHSWYMYEKYKTAIDLIADKDNANLYREQFYDKKTDSLQLASKLIFSQIPDAANPPQQLSGEFQIKDKKLAISLEKVYPLANKPQQEIRLPITSKDYFYTVSIDYQPNRLKQELRKVNIYHKDGKLLRSFSHDGVYRSGDDVRPLGDTANGIILINKATEKPQRFNQNDTKDYVKDDRYDYVVAVLNGSEQSWDEWAKANGVEGSLDFEFKIHQNENGNTVFQHNYGLSYVEEGEEYRMVDSIAIPMGWYGNQLRLDEYNINELDLEKGVRTLVERRCNFQGKSKCAYQHTKKWLEQSGQKIMDKVLKQASE